MACRGVHFALNADDCQRLLSAQGDEELLSVIQEDIEATWDREWLCETDKAWDAIHRCLTDGTLIPKGASVLEKCVLGGRQLYNGDDYIVSYLTPQEVRDVAAALQPIQEAWFRKRYFGLRKRFLRFTRSAYEGPIGEEDLRYSWSCFEAVILFFEKAAAAGRSVIFTVDQ